MMFSNTISSLTVHMHCHAAGCGRGKSFFRPIDMVVGLLHFIFCCRCRALKPIILVCFDLFYCNNISLLPFNKGKKRKTMAQMDAGLMRRVGPVLCALPIETDFILQVWLVCCMWSSPDAEEKVFIL